jgi:hypothetical protein
MRTFTNKVSPDVWIPVLIGVPLSLIGLAPIVMLGIKAAEKPTLIALCLVSIAFGLLILNSSLARIRALRQEPKAVSKIRLPSGWKKSDLLGKEHGNKVGLLLISDDGTRYAVLIKPYQGVMIRRFKMGKSESLHYKDGRMFSLDPVKSALTLAEEAECLPVLWLPNAKAERPLRMKCGLVVVQGDERQLMKAVHGGGWFNTFTQRLS